MDAADGSIHSKVIVQFTDPSGLFDDVSPLLRNRLPLGNLHWKSPTRPLRSIEELDVSLDREQTASADGTTGAGARRHQIPGLRQTPFVKVLLVRCDDKEKYKETVRKDIKDWIKTLGLSTSGKSTVKGQERHDAYEYLIVHVVYPGTAAASQPKSSKHISLDASESTDSVNSKSKWTGKSSSTILDKLKADFSSSSKAPFERVAQIRLNDPSNPSPTLSSLELEEQWQNLVDKLKTAILQSFDARVAQYEDDIQERENQRNLPGWNFCTFFILKEGLAKGFENVGLLEDAIQLYEELDAELDVVIQDQARADYSDAANALLPYAVDLKDTIRTVLDRNGEQQQTEAIALNLQGWVKAEADRFPWRLERRNYQHMILTNQVSALDFRIYIFIRQMQIMLRRASVAASTPRSKTSKQESGPRWDANLLAEVCERSTRFLILAARNLRQDLYAAWGGQQGLSDDELSIQEIAIDNIVASWKWASLLQTLSDCQITSSFSSLAAKINGDADQAEVFSPADFASSMPSHDHNQSVSTTTLSDAGTSVNGATPLTARDAFSAIRVAKGNKLELIFRAAELFAMLRTILLQLCQHTGMLPYLTKASFPASKVVVDSSLAWTGILAPSLRSALQSEESALGAYRLVTICACQCYTTAGKLRVSRQLLFDLAEMEAQSGNYEDAASWLDAVPGFLEAPPQTSVEQSMLGLYIKCLRNTNRKEEFIQSLFLEVQSSSCSGINLQSAQRAWDEMLELAQDTNKTNLPFEALFTVEKLDAHVQHDTDDCCCTLHLKMRNLVSLTHLGQTKIQLQYQRRSSGYPNTVCFTHEGEIVTQNDLIEATLKTDVVTEGWYDLKELHLSFGNLTLKHDFQRQRFSSDEEEHVPHPPFITPSIYMYPSIDEPRFRATQATHIDISEKRNASIMVDWGANKIAVASVTLKPATAGARLDLASTSVAEKTSFDLTRGEDSSILVFRDISPNSQSTILIPYSLDDNSVTSLSIRVEMKYTSARGARELFDLLSFMTLLPIAVNVQDIFQTNRTFSRFTISPSHLIPVSVTDCVLKETSICNVLTPGPWSEPIEAFPKQPISWVVQARPSASHAPIESEKLEVAVKYQCMDEVILETILDNFCRAIKDSTFAYAARPLVEHLRSRLQSVWREREIELATLVSEIELWAFNDIDWDVILTAFAKVERARIRSWLLEWHRLNQKLALQPRVAPERTLRLLVDLPRTDIVVVADVKPLAEICLVGQPMLAKVVLTPQLRTDRNVEVTVEVTAQADSWLIGGQRKATFAANQGTFEGTIVLIAQKTGDAMLPAVEIRCRDVKDSSKAVACEVEHSSSARIVTVRSDVRSTTIGIGEEETSEGHWLVESGKRR